MFWGLYNIQLFYELNSLCWDNFVIERINGHNPTGIKILQKPTNKMVNATKPPIKAIKKTRRGQRPNSNVKRLCLVHCRKAVGYYHRGRLPIHLTTSKSQLAIGRSYTSYIILRERCCPFSAESLTTLLQHPLKRTDRAIVDLTAFWKNTKLIK